MLAALLCTASTFAQGEEATTLPSDTELEPPPTEDEAVRAGQEVEINEDNYRQFMELKDPRQQKSMLPENSYQSQAGMQKLDKLPEDSQKHLRNQLREIILDGDQWQPGDEDAEYPYVPSVAAATNQGLKNQEAEAWGELVDNYHQREAEIYENSSRSQAAAAASGTSRSPGASGEGGDGKEGTAGGGSGQAGEGQESSQESNSEPGGSAGSYSPTAADDPNATSTEGVSQNAMEFLAGSIDGNSDTGESNSGESNSGESNAGSGTGSDNMGEAQENAQAAQQDSGEQNNTASTSAAQVPTNEPREESTSGTSQNALQYLTEGNTQGDQPTQQESGTLTIEDLLNARGVRGAAGSSTTPGIRIDADQPADKDPDKDG